MSACRFYGCGNRINSGVLTTLRFSLPALRVSADFYNADMLALCEILLHHANGALSYIRRLDFSLSGLESSNKSAQHGQHGRHDAPSGLAPGLTSHGALTLSKVLHVARHIEEVNLRRNNIGPFGASAIFLACFENPYSRVGKINMRRCRVGERGALVLAELLAKSHDKTNHEASPHIFRPLALREIDLSSNYIGVQGCVELDRALQHRHKALVLFSSAADETTRTTTTIAPNHAPPFPISINLEGNLVFSEVMNGVTHGLGSLLSLVAVYVMHQQVRDKDWFHVASCAVYSASLVILYISSTLFHSFFSMQQTKYIFQAIDKCAIYLLIAGTYTPYLLIMMMPERPDFTMTMLAVLWIGCFLGIGVEAFWKEWKWRGTFSLSMYLGMGWSALAGFPILAPIIPTKCLYLMVAGGVTYTLGVPFFVRDGYLDHAIWHMFVLAASIFHWLSIYWYVATWPAPYVVENDSTVSIMVATALATFVPSSCPDMVESPAAPPVLEMLLTQA
jgi:hemolysin III